MRNRAIIGGGITSLGVLAVALQLGAGALAPAVVTSTGTTTSGASGTSGTSSSGGTTGTTTTPATGGATDGTYTGQSVGTRYGNVQVAVTISGGAITDVAATHLTDADGRSVQISNRAAPLLRTEVLNAQSASVSTIGGATYTSQAYLSSLQSALDQAGF